jgi:LCP family protein required for cell wall assembly
VVSVNEKTGRIVLTSLLRDLYLSIPEYSNNRLNAAFALGGVGLLENTLKTNFGIEIDRYIAIDFSAFTTIIDTLGGIDLTLTEDDCKNIFPGQNKQPGVYKLDGEHALIYARWRKGASDFERTERQRTLMTTVIRRMLGMSLTELTDVMEITFPKVRTDLTEWDCLSILMNVGDLTDYEIDTQRIPFAGTWEYATVNRKSVLTLDIEENRRLFFESITKSKDD